MRDTECLDDAKMVEPSVVRATASTQSTPVAGEWQLWMQVDPRDEGHWSSERVQQGQEQAVEVGSPGVAWGEDPSVARVMESNLSFPPDLWAAGLPLEEVSLRDEMAQQEEQVDTEIPAGAKAELQSDARVTASILFPPLRALAQMNGQAKVAVEKGLETKAPQQRGEVNGPSVDALLEEGKASILSVPAPAPALEDLVLEVEEPGVPNRNSTSQLVHCPSPDPFSQSPEEQTGR